MLPTVAAAAHGSRDRYDIADLGMQNETNGGRLIGAYNVPTHDEENTMSVITRNIRIISVALVIASALSIAPAANASCASDFEDCMSTAYTYLAFGALFYSGGLVRLAVEMAEDCMIDWYYCAFLGL